MEEIWERGRKVVSEIMELARVGKEQDALDLLDDALSEAIRENRGTWVSVLCGQGAILSDAVGDRGRRIRYKEMALPFARDYRFAAYNFAQLLLSDGQVARAECYARDAYRQSISGETEADRDLAAAILKQWPNAAEIDS